jgi:hypothetical protein
MKVIRIIGITVVFLLFGATVPAFAQEHHEEGGAAKPTQAKPAQHEPSPKAAKQESHASAAERGPKPTEHASQAKPVKQENHASVAKQEAKPTEHVSQAKPAKQQNHASAADQEAKPAEHASQAKPAKQENEARAENKQTQSKQSHSKEVRQESQSKQASHESEQHGRAGGEQHAQRTPAEEQRQRAVPALRLSARGSGRIPDDRFRSNFGRGHEFRIGNPILVGGYSRFQYGGYSFGFIQPWPIGWYYTDDVYVDYIDGGYYLYNPYYPGARVSINVVI